MAQRKVRQTKAKYKTRKVTPRVIKEPTAQYVFTPMAIIPTEHPHIVRKPSSGEPIIRDVGLSVRGVVEMTYRLKQKPDEILDGWEPELTLAKLYDALSYYHDHKKEIDDIIKANDRAGERALKLSRKLAKEYKARQRLKAKEAGQNGG